jgi:hypothetical protein
MKDVKCDHVEGFTGSREVVFFGTAKGARGRSEEVRVRVDPEQIILLGDALRANPEKIGHAVWHVRESKPVHGSHGACPSCEHPDRVARIPA